MKSRRSLPLPRAAALACAAALAATLASLAGCGYALVGRASNVPENVRQVYLKPLENKTTRSQVEQSLTRAIADELVTRHRFAVVSSPTGADAEISGSVVGFNATPVTFDPTGRATEYEILITAQVAFKRLDNNQVLWSSDRYTFRENYPVEATGTAYFDRENLAIDKAAKQFAQTMVGDLLEGF
jgi:outer membrane lipopolysaccharide assembly protein LptE/RlpB